MKAVIMAGGKGTRLRPLTNSTPKPLLPVAGVPAIKRIISQLKKHGVDRAAITVGYLSEKIEAELGKEFDGVKLTYIKEEKPLGTAGGVAGARDFIGGEDFIVISGDAVCETDLRSAAEFREKHDSLVTVILTRASDPSEYGVVLVSDDGDIIGFCEKPSLSATYTDTVSTGIYVMSSKIFDFIPDGESDFGRDIFPLLLSNGEKMTAVIDENYWCDIGDHHSFRMANLRYQNGKNVIGADCSISDEKSIVGSVLLQRVKVGDGTKIENSIICSDTSIGSNCILGENCIIGENSFIGDGSILESGTVLDCGSVIPEYSHVRTGTSVSRSALSSMLDGKGISCEIRRLQPSFCMRLGASLSEAVGFGKIGIMTDGSPDSDRISAAILRGIGIGGGESILLGEGFEASCSYAAVKMSLDLSVFVRVIGDGCQMSFFDKDGLYPKREFERALLSAIGNDRSRSEQNFKTSKCSFTNEYYLPMLCSNRCALDHFKLSIKNENAASSLLKRVLLDIGADICESELRFSVSDDGFSLFIEQDGFVCDDFHIKALLLKYLIRHTVSLPVSTPSAMIDICYKKAELYTHCPGGNSEDDIRKNVKNTPELTHACAAAAEIAGLLAVSGKTLKDLCRHLPKFAVSSYDYKTKDRSHFTILPHLGVPSGDGIVSEYEKGSVRIIPSRDGYHLMSEAASGEYAEELISLSEKEIKNLLKKMRKD